MDNVTRHEEPECACTEDTLCQRCRERRDRIARLYRNWRRSVEQAADIEEERRAS